MEPINMTRALLLSCLVPGLGLWKVEHGKLVLFFGFVPAGFLILFGGFMTLGFGFLFAPVLWAGALFQTWYSVRAHNRQAAKEAGVAHEIASLKEQVQNLST